MCQNIHLPRLYVCLLSNYLCLQLKEPQTVFINDAITSKMIRETFVNDEGIN